MIELAQSNQCAHRITGFGASAALEPDTGSGGLSGSTEAAKGSIRVLYLAEVKKQSKGLIGGTKTELKLLAFQRNDQSWSAVRGEESIACESLSHLGEGALVMVNLRDNRQIQETPEPAGAQLVRLLQKLSRLMDKSKEQEEEIEQWKQSLTYQSEELARRELEMESRIEQIEQMEAKFGPLQSSAAAGSNLLQQQLDLTFEAVSTQQQNLDGYWQQLEQQKEAVEQYQGKVQEQAQSLETHQQNRHSTLAAIEETKLQLQEQQTAFKSKQEQVNRLNLYRQNIEELQELTARLAESGSVMDDHQIDTQALETMPLGELQTNANNLRQELEKLALFVNDQEEELTLQTQAVQELQEQVQTASEYDRITLEEELADEQERKRMLDETLLGQRRTLRERQEVLLQHLRILRRRQGTIELDDSTQQIDLDPVVIQLEAQQNRLQKEQQRLEADIEQLRQSIRQLKETLQQQEAQLQQLEKQLQEQEKSWQQAQLEANQLQAQIKVREETLEPLQTGIKQMWQQLEAVRQQLNSQDEEQAIA